MRGISALMLVPCLVLSAAPRHVPKNGSVRSARDAKAIAELDTGGIAVSARRVPLNGATGGWEVEIRMPHEDRGWRCIVDCDTRAVFTKTRIPNPKVSKKKKKSNGLA